MSAAAKRRIAPLFAALWLAPVAHAQDTEIGSRLQRRQLNAIPRADAHSIAFAHYMTRCAVTKYTDAARRYLDSLDQRSIAKARNAMFGRELSCADLPGASDFATDVRIVPPKDIERGLIAEALLARMPDKSLPAAQPLAAEYKSPWLALSGREPVVEEMAACVAAIDPPGIAAVLRTLPESRGEGQALSSLTPSLGRCLVSNAKLTANHQSLRAALAEALYHRQADPTLSLAAAPGTN